MRHSPNLFRFQMGDKINMVKCPPLLLMAAALLAGPSKSPSYHIIVLFIED